MRSEPNTSPNDDPDIQQLRLALDHISVGLGELEQLLIRRENSGKPDSLALQDAAGAIALGTQEIRRALAAGGAGLY